MGSFWRCMPSAAASFPHWTLESNKGEFWQGLCKTSRSHTAVHLNVEGNPDTHQVVWRWPKQLCFGAHVPSSVEKRLCVVYRVIWWSHSAGVAVPYDAPQAIGRTLSMLGEVEPRMWVSWIAALCGTSSIAVLCQQKPARYLSPASWKCLPLCSRGCSMWKTPILRVILVGVGMFKIELGTQ